MSVRQNEMSHDDARRALSDAFEAGYQHKPNPFFEDSVDLAKRAVPFGSPGGKTRWAPLLLAMFPMHDFYVEPYIGGGGVFWNKEPVGKEIINDLNPDIIGVYRFLQCGTAEDFKWIRRQIWKASERRFKRLLKWEAPTLREQAYRFKYLSIYSVRKAGDIWCKSGDRARRDGRLSPVGGGLFLRNLEKFSDRLANVEIRCVDAVKLMKETDRPGAFMYLDPPWKPVARSVGWREFDGDEFAKQIATMESTLLVSYQGPLELGDQWSKESITMGKASGFATPSVQDVYSNYEIERDDEVTATKSFDHFFGGVK